jgi:hypothetical protein
MDISELGKQNKKPVRIFCCYAREDQPLLLHFKTQMAALQHAGLVTLWADTDINAGGEWEKEIHSHLDTADIILLFVSPDFMASNYSYSIEMQKALERHKRREARVIPIILRPVHWEEAPFSKLQILPTNATPVTHKKWRDLDDAFLDVVNGILSIIETLTGKSFPREYVSSLSQTISAPPMLVRPSPISTPVKENQKQSHPARIILLGFLIIFLLGGVVASIYAYIPRGPRPPDGSTPPIGETATALANANATATALTNAQATRQANANATATATVIGGILSSYDSIISGTPTFSDPLNDPNQTTWGLGATRLGTCTIANGALHDTTTGTGYAWNCFNHGQRNFANFVYRIQVTIIQGGGGGITFRATPQGAYRFDIQQDGGYTFKVGQQQNTSSVHSPQVKAGFNQTNTIAVMADGATMYFFINDQYVTRVEDNTLNNGIFGVIADGTINQPADVAFSKAQIWTT